MKKTKFLGLLSLASILTLGLASVNETSLTVVDAEETTKTINLGDSSTGFSNWNSSYMKRTITSTTFEEGDTVVTFEKANKQSSTITDCPVTKASNNTIALKGNAYFTSMTFTFKKWTTKNPSFVIGYDGGTDTKITTFQSTVTIEIPADLKVTSVYFNNTNSNQVGYVSISYTAVLDDQPLTLSELADKYYNKGVYTKETTINATTAAQNELTELRLFHGSNELDRTTYFNGNALWMTNDAGVNSGYGTVTNENLADVQKVSKNAAVGDMTHFSIVEGYPVYNYTVAMSDHTGMEGYYRTVCDLAEEDYFAEADWTYEDGAYVHTVELANRATDQYLKDFLAIAAPCLYNSSLENYFLVNKLVVKEENDQLLLQILVDYNSNSHSDKVDNAAGVLAQATISVTGNENFYWAGANPKEVNAIASLDELVSGGTYLIGFDKIAYLGAYYSSNNYYTAVANNIDALQLTFTSTDSGWTISYDYNGTPSYLSLSTDGNKANYSETEYYWNITQNDDGTFAIQPSTYTARYLQYNSNEGQERFACYKGTQNFVSIYELV